jgi:2-deoxy-D-gluconate 3-dehydrogenase
MVTDATAALWEDAKRHAQLLARIPAGRWGAPEDLKGAVVFLSWEHSALRRRPKISSHINNRA